MYNYILYNICIYIYTRINTHRHIYIYMYIYTSVSNRNMMGYYRLANDLPTSSLTKSCRHFVMGINMINIDKQWEYCQQKLVNHSNTWLWPCGTNAPPIPLAGRWRNIGPPTMEIQPKRPGISGVKTSGGCLRLPHLPFWASKFKVTCRFLRSYEVLHNLPSWFVT